MCTNLTIGLKNENNPRTFFFRISDRKSYIIKVSRLQRKTILFSTVSNIYILFSTSSVSNRITYCFVKLHFFHFLFSRRPCCFSTVSRSLFFINIRVVSFQKNTILLFYGFLIQFFLFLTVWSWFVMLQRCYIFLTASTLFLLNVIFNIIRESFCPQPFSKTL